MYWRTQIRAFMETLPAQSPPLQAPSPRVIYSRGVSLYARGQFARAADELARLGDQDGPIGRMARFYAGKSHQKLGLADLAAGRFDAAVSRFKSAEQLLGASARLDEYLGRTRMSAGDAASGIEHLRRATQSDHATPRHHQMLAQSLWRTGRRDEAVDTLQAAWQDRCGQGRIAVQAALFALERQDDQAALEWLGRAVQADPQCAEAHYYLGMVRASRSDVAGAFSCLSRAFALRPDRVLWGYQLSLAGKAMQAKGRRVCLSASPAATQQARARDRSLAEKVIDDPDIVTAMLDLPTNEGDGVLFRSLCEALTLAVDQHPTRADLHLRRAEVLSRLGEYNPAVESAERALGINPGLAPAELVLCHLKARLGQSVEAVAHLRRAISGGQDYPDVHYQASQMLLRMDWADGARKHLKRALELKSNYEKAAEALESLAA